MEGHERSWTARAPHDEERIFGERRETVGVALQHEERHADAPVERPREGAGKGRSDRQDGADATVEEVAMVGEEEHGTPAERQAARPDALGIDGARESAVPGE